MDAMKAVGMVGLKVEKWVRYWAETTDTMKAVGMVGLKVEKWVCAKVVTMVAEMDILRVEMWVLSKAAPTAAKSDENLAACLVDW